MVINKRHTPKKEEESSSLKKQKLFIRRPDLTPEIRLELAISGLGLEHRDCTIKELKAKYKVSHTFIYNQSAILRNNAPALFGVPPLGKAAVLDQVLDSIRFLLECKLETKGALHGLSNFGQSQGIAYTSTNFISELIEVAGTLVGNTYDATQAPLLVTFLCDEVYSGGQAILVTIEAQSMMALDIRLTDGSLTSADWEASFDRLSDNEIVPKELIKDQGKQMACAIEVLPEQTIIGADTFHAIAHRLGIFRCRLKREVQTAQDREADRAVRFAATKTYLTALKKEQEWEIAKYKTLQAIDRLDWFDEYYFKIIQQLRPFTSAGIPRDKEAAKLIIQQSMQALAFLDIPKLEKQLHHIENLLQNGQLLHFMDQVPELHQQLQPLLEQDTSWLWMLYWQWNKKSYQTHCSSVHQRAKQEALAAQQLLKEHYQQMAGQNNLSSFDQIQDKVFEVLDQIVQASSLVETFNSILKPFINNTRGQVTQALLNLVQFYHNHRIFKRGKRKNKAPVELLTGNSLQKHWIDLLMDKIKNAFQQYDVVSLKQLHTLICKKNKDAIKDLDMQNQSNLVDIAA